MRIRKKIVKVAAILGMAGLGLWSLGAVTAQAADATDLPKYQTNAAALKAAPQGVDLTSDEYSTYFTINKSIKGTDSTNSAVLKGTDDGVGSPSGKGNSVIQISSSGNFNTWGSIWSSEKKFDLSKPETASMWVFLSGPTNASVGDGMAFVLQNDEDGTQAFSGTTTTGVSGGISSPVKTTVDVPGVGESMGVWGMDPSEYTSHDLATSAIQNSWALEFDTFNNNFKPDLPNILIANWDLDDDYHPSSFDSGNYFNNFDSKGEPEGSGTTVGSDNHIASNYPGNKNTYTSESQLGQKKTWTPVGKYSYIIPYTDKYYYYKMTHLGYLDEGATGQEGSMTDYRWHHITLDYTPPTGSDTNGQMTYTFNDKDPVTGVPQASSDSQTVPINLSKLNADGDDSKVYWGFTGSTGGSASENNLVVFDQLPGEAETAATATLSQKNDDGTFSAVDSSTAALTGGTTVKLEYDFKRTGGLKDWNDINAELTIPKSISLTSGTVSRPDGSNDAVDLSKQSGTDLPITLGRDGNGLTLSGSQGGKVTLYGTVGDMTATEDSTTSYFQGSNATSAAKLTGFSVKQATLSMDIDDAASTLKVNFGSEGSDVKVIGVVVATDKTLPRSDITIYPTLNGEELASFKADDEAHIQSGYGTDGFNYTIPNDKLKKGANTISFRAETASGDKSVPISREITAGALELRSTGDLSYGSSMLNGAGTILERDNAWSLYVDDSLVTKNTWELDAATTGMYRDGTPTNPKLDGALIFKDSQDDSSNPGVELSMVPLKIDSGGTDGTSQSTNIAADWNDDTGIRLKINSGATEGTYSGEITWTFVNSAS